MMQVLSVVPERRSVGALGGVPCLVLVAVASVLCAACATPKVDAPPNPAHRLGALRGEVQALLEERNAQSWAAWVGEPVGLASAPVENRDWIFSDTSLQLVATHLSETSDKSERHALRNIHGFLLSERVLRGTADVQSQVAALKAKSVLAPASQEGARNTDVSGPDPILFIRLNQALADEARPGLRRSLSDAARPTLANINRLLWMQIDQERALSRELGSNGYLALATEVRQIDVVSVRHMAETVLRDSEALYLSALRDLAPRRAGVGVESLTLSDIPRVFRRPELDAAFPRQRLTSAVWSTFEAMGVASATKPRIHTGPRRGGHVGAACFPVQLPADIRVAVESVGGVSDYAALLHELGHALHYTHASEQPFENSLLADTSASEAMAFVFDGLMTNETWLSGHMHLKGVELADAVRVASFQRLYMVRRYAATVLFELELYRSRPSQPWTLEQASERHAALMSDALGFPIAGADMFLLGRGPFLYSAAYLKAWLLAGHLSAFLEREYSDAWWQTPEAGEWLVSLWSGSAASNHDTLAAAIDVKHVSPTPLLRRIAVGLVSGD